MENKLLTVAKKYGTPIYVYDFDKMALRLQHLRSSLNHKTKLYYAVKANPNLELLKNLEPYVDGLDLSSGGEIKQALLAGYHPSTFSFAGPGKKKDEIAYAIQSDCGSISAESIQDLKNIIACAEKLEKTANISLRISPTKSIGQFAMKMAGRPTQFGLEEEEIEDAVKLIRSCSDIVNFVGFHIYAGTQCLEPSSLLQNTEYILDLIDRISNNFQLHYQHINIGGGFGIPYYSGDQDLDINVTINYINDAILEHNKKCSHTVSYVLELGRYIVGEFGYYLTKVIARKPSKGKTFLIVDGGMHQNLSASGNLGQVIRRNYKIQNISSNGGETETVNVAGCLCAPIDLIASNIDLPRCKIGDILVTFNSGAYGFTASPLLFLGHDTPKEVLIKEGKAELIRGSKDITFFNY